MDLGHKPCTTSITLTFSIFFTKTTSGRIFVDKQSFCLQNNNNKTVNMESFVISSSRFCENGVWISDKNVDHILVVSSWILTSDDVYIKKLLVSKFVIKFLICKSLVFRLVFKNVTFDFKVQILNPIWVVSHWIFALIPRKWRRSLKIQSFSCSIHITWLIRTVVALNGKRSQRNGSGNHVANILWFAVETWFHCNLWKVHCCPEGTIIWLPDLSFVNLPTPAGNFNRYNAHQKLTSFMHFRANDK